MWKIWYRRTGHRWQYYMAHALCMVDHQDCRHTLRICNTYSFSTATMVTRMLQQFLSSPEGSYLACKTWL